MTDQIEAAAPIEFDLSYLNIEEAVVRFNLPQICPGAFFLVKPSTSENAKYTAASHRMSQKRQQSIGATGTLSKADADMDRNEDRVLYPKYVIVGWGGIKDKHNNDVPFSAQDCRALVAQLPNTLFDRLRIHCMKFDAFLDPEDQNEKALPNPSDVAEN